MTKVFGLLLMTLVSSSAIAGIDPETLADTLKMPEVKEALKNQEINSVKVVYDRMERARFDYDIVICGVSSEIEKGTSVIIYHKTKIYGRLAFFNRYNEGDITTTSGPAVDGDCKSQL